MDNIYIGIMLYVGIISLLFKNLNFSIGRKTLNVKEKEAVYMFLIFSVLILVAGFRNNSVGVDTKAYQAFFEVVKKVRFLDIFESYYPVCAGGDVEIGYVFLCKICSFFSNNYYFFQMINALIIGFFSAKFIRDNSDDVFMSTVLYLGLGMYLSSFNVTRQWMAAAIACNGWTMLKRSKIKGILLLAIGFSIHFSAIFVALAALIYIFKKSKFWIKIIPIGIVFVMLRYEILLELVGPYLPSKYAIYLLNLSDPQNQVLNFITYAIIVGLLIMHVVIGRKAVYQYKFYAILGAIYVACEIIGMSFNRFERLGWPFMYFVLLLLPAGQKYIQNRRLKKTYYIFIIVFYSFLFVHRALNTAEFVYASYLFN